MWKGGEEREGVAGIPRSQQTRTGCGKEIRWGRSSHALPGVAAAAAQSDEGGGRRHEA